MLSCGISKLYKYSHMVTNREQMSDEKVSWQDIHRNNNIIQFPNCSIRSEEPVQPLLLITHTNEYPWTWFKQKRAKWLLIELSWLCNLTYLVCNRATHSFF
jgi:hypothetical protein